MSVNMKSIIDNLMEGIKFYINERFKTAPYDRTDTAIIKGISEFGYVISYNNTLYSDVKTTGGTCSINETVKIVIPQNNINNIFILKGADITTLEENFINKDKITNSGVINVDGYVVDAKQLNPNISNTLAWKINQNNIINGIKNYGTLEMWSESSDINSNEGSQIYFRGKGGNGGETIVIDAFSNFFRVYGNFNSGSLVVYEFHSDGIYKNGVKITN